MTVLRWLLRLVVAVLALVALLFFGARFHDGPLGPIPGAGVSPYDLAVPLAWPRGQYRVFQGLEIDGGTGLLIERTNSIPTLVR